MSGKRSATGHDRATRRGSHTFWLQDRSITSFPDQILTRKLTVHYPLRLANTEAERKRILQEHPNRTVGSRDFHIDLVGQFAEAGVMEMCCATQDRVEDLQQVDEEIIAAFDTAPTEEPGAV